MGQLICAILCAAFVAIDSGLLLGLASFFALAILAPEDSK